MLLGPETMGETGLVFANVEDPDGNHFGIFCPPPGLSDSATSGPVARRSIVARSAGVEELEAG